MMVGCSTRRTDIQIVCYKSFTYRLPNLKLVPTSPEDTCLVNKIRFINRVILCDLK